MLRASFDVRVNAAFVAVVWPGWLFHRSHLSGGRVGVREVPSKDETHTCANTFVVSHDATAMTQPKEKEKKRERKRSVLDSPCARQHIEIRRWGHNGGEATAVGRSPAVHSNSLEVGVILYTCE